MPGMAALLRPAMPDPDVAVYRPASGREQHTHKITVYLSADELFALEHARLALRRYGISADRGRLVREAIAVVLADLDAQGDTSLLARRLAPPSPTEPSSDETEPGSVPGPGQHGPGQPSLGQPSLGQHGPGQPSLGQHGGGGGDHH
jgi:hypothetical protein